MGLGGVLVLGGPYVAIWGLIGGLFCGLTVGLLSGWPYKSSAANSQLTFVWPSNIQQLFDFLRRVRRGLFRGLGFGLVVGVSFGLGLGVIFTVLDFLGLADLRRGNIVGLAQWLFVMLIVGLFFGLVFGPVFGLVFGLVDGLVKPQSVLVIARSPEEASSRSLKAALIWIAVGLAVGLVLGLSLGLMIDPGAMSLFGLTVGLGLGLGLGLRNGGGFVLLQKVAHRRLARSGNLPPRPANFLEWGIEQQIFRRVGGGVRFRHNLIQQHLANTSVGEQETSTVGAKV